MQYGDVGFGHFLRSAWLASAGLDRDDLDRPVIGIADTSSDFSPCHRQMPELVDAVRRGVLEAGGLPMRFPTVSLGEILLSPTAMLFRNLMAMETEELIRAQPIDAVVLLGGCDKTVPAQLMAAISANVPAILVVAGPTIPGNVDGARVAGCTDCRRLWAEHRAGNVGPVELDRAGLELFATAGTCGVMGTASTMAAIAEALGLMLPYGAAAPAASGARLRHAVVSGRAAVRLARTGVRPIDVLSEGSFRNALATLAAIGGSTNAVIHLTAIARRAGIPIGLDDFAAASAAVPVLVDCRPVGKAFFADVHDAGGIPLVLRRVRPHLDESASTVAGGTIRDVVEAVRETGGTSVIRTVDDPVSRAGGLRIVRGTLAPDGAVLKAAAATSALLEHRGKAVVFESVADLEARIDDPSLMVAPDDVLVLRNAGPVAAGMPEAGSLPIPSYLAARGVRDMLRISDARMSGTAYGTVVLHCAPEAAVGGPLALVRSGDTIEIDAFRGRLDLLVSTDELERRRQVLVPRDLPERGWRRLVAERTLQADKGADLDFMVAS